MELTGHGVCFSDRKSTTQWNTRILYGTTTFRCAIRRSRGLNRRLDCKSCNQRQQRSRTFDRPLKIAGRCSILNVELMVTYGLRNEGGNILNCSVPYRCSRVLQVLELKQELIQKFAVECMLPTLFSTIMPLIVLVCWSIALDSPKRVH